MDSDPELCQCVEITCPECCQTFRMARCRNARDAGVQVHIYRRNLKLVGLNCQRCGTAYGPDAVQRVDRSLEWAQEDL